MVVVVELELGKREGVDQLDDSERHGHELPHLWCDRMAQQVHVHVHVHVRVPVPAHVRVRVRVRVCAATS